MLRTSIFLLLLFFSTNSSCQINSDSLIGKYVFENWVGGGFTGGSNGECIALPPDYLINNTLIIDSNLMITKVSDTTGHRKLYIDWNCDTLYIGKLEIDADTIIATFTMKPVCPDFFSTNNDKNAQQYEILDSPVIE